MDGFSMDRDYYENIGEIVLEALLISNIDSIVDLNLRWNISWFNHPTNVDLIEEIISKQAGMKHINLSS